MKRQELDHEFIYLFIEQINFFTGGAEKFQTLPAHIHGRGSDVPA